MIIDIEKERANDKRVIGQFYDANKCNSAIWSGYRHHQCTNKPSLDGYCKAHHPQLREDRKLARYAKQEAIWNERSKAMADAYAERAALESDAAKWRALRGSQRITAMGSAGLDKPENGYAHITLNFWTGIDHEAGPGPAWALEWLDKYVEIALKNAKP